MTIGLSASHANALLNIFRGTSFTAVSLAVALHIGDPLGAGTAAQSAVTTRINATFAAPSGGSMSLSSNVGPWTMTATENLSHISTWDNVTAGSGNFLRSVALTASRSVVASDTFTLATLTLAYAPIAA